MLDYPYSTEPFTVSQLRIMFKQGKRSFSSIFRLSINPVVGSMALDQTFKLMMLAIQVDRIAIVTF